MIDWQKHKLALSTLTGSSPHYELTPEVHQLKTLLGALLTEMESNQWSSDSRIAGLEASADIFRARLDKFTAREEDMAKTGVPKQDRPAAHRGLDRIEGDDNG